MENAVLRCLGLGCGLEAPPPHELDSTSMRVRCGWVGGCVCVWWWVLGLGVWNQRSNQESKRKSCMYNIWVASYTGDVYHHGNTALHMFKLRPQAGDLLDDPQSWKARQTPGVSKNSTKRSWNPWFCNNPKAPRMSKDCENCWLSAFFLTAWTLFWLVGGPSSQRPPSSRFLGSLVSKRMALLWASAPWVDYEDSSGASGRLGPEAF